MISDDVQKVLKLYQQKGYYNAEVTSKVEFPKDPRKAVVSFNIVKRDKVYIKSIEFAGNKNISSRKLRGVMQTKVKSILSLVTDRGILQKDILETDIDRLTAYYHDEGYMDAKVSLPNTVLEKDGFHISIALEEGERYMVSDVKMTGDLLEDYEKKIMKKLELKPKSYFSREKLRHDMDVITRAYMNEGYARVEVDPRVRRNIEDHTAEIAFNIDKKGSVRIGQIFVTGNTKTRDNVIRRELLIYEGDVYNGRKIEDSLTKLKKLDYFENVEIVPTDTDVKDVMNLNVKVKEKQTGSLSVGGGFSTMDGLFATAQIQQKNLFGQGDYVSIKAYVGQLAQRYIFSYTKPWLFGTPLSGGIDIYNWLRVYQDFTAETVGFKMRFGYPLGQFSNLTGYYTWQIGKIDNMDTLASLDTKTFNNNFQTSCAGQERDWPCFRTKYDRSSFSAHQRHLHRRQFCGVRLYSTRRRLQPFQRTSTMSGSMSHFFGNSSGICVVNSDLKTPGGLENFPIYERYFLGGIDSLRGWQFGEVGPTDNCEAWFMAATSMWLSMRNSCSRLLEKYGVRGAGIFRCR